MLDKILDLYRWLVKLILAVAVHGSPHSTSDTVHLDAGIHPNGFQNQCRGAVSQTSRNPNLIVTSRPSVLSSRTLFFLVLAGLLALPTSLLLAQMATITNANMAPVPGAGHDYTKLLNETVNPANGSVSVQINLPMPKGRGLSIPFSLNYNSGQVEFFDPFIDVENLGAEGTNSVTVGNMKWVGNRSVIASGGWNYGLPLANWSSYTSEVTTGNYQDPGGSTTACPLDSGFSFSDLSGQFHELGIGVAGNQQNNSGTACESSSYVGGDDYVSASVPSSTVPYGNGSLGGPLTVSDKTSGTTYFFDGFLRNSTPNGGQNSQSTGSLPYRIEDRNGNQINVTQPNNGLFSFSFTDTLGNQVVSDSGFGSSPETIVAGGLSYTIKWITTSASYTPPASANVADSSGVCSGVQPVNDSQVKVISEIDLPSGQAYHFLYNTNANGMTNGLLSEIDYPDGGWVRYNWWFSDTYSELLYYNSGETYVGQYGSTSTPNGCQYQYSVPVISTRTVSFDGKSTALTQTFTYSTSWDQRNPNTWDSKTTTTQTQDMITGKTFKRVYVYGAVGGDTPPYTAGFAPQIAVENTVTTYDWGSSGTPLDVSTKAWYDQYQLACEFHTLDGTATSGHFYQYGPGVQVSDDKAYDFGQIGSPTSSGCVGNGTNGGYGHVPAVPSSPTPLRETTRSFQTFTNPLGTTFSSPQSEIVYGSGAKASKTDYGYDGGSLAGANAVMHDEAAFPAGVVANRGNVTSITRQCVYGCGTPVTTTASYDETGQMVSSTDGCGNSNCSDVSGGNHTTTYVYADSPASSGGRNTNAYLTLMTDPLGHTQNFSYNYTYGEVTSATDSNGMTTTYRYGTQAANCPYMDHLDRLTETDYPIGVTTKCYNDAGQSVSTSMSINPTTTETTNSSRDGVGHVTQTQLTTDPAGTDYTDTVYDGTGQVYSVSNPHSSKTLSSDGITTYLRDALGRLTTQTQPDKSMQTYTYAGNVTTFTDEVSNTWKRTSDALGRLTQVIEPGGLETDYGYDGLDDLTSVVQHGTAAESARSRSFTYDSLSRLLTSTNPETGNNGQPGTICYGLTGSGSCQSGYDANGNLASRTDARGVVTQYSYDALNRLIGKVYTNAPAGSLSSCYQYDTATDGIGRLAASWTQAGSCPAQLPATGFLTSKVYVTYDVMGRLQQQQQCVPGKCAAQAGSPFTMNYAYDLAGNTASMGDGLGQVSWALSYDGAGRLSTVNGTTAPGIPNPAQLFANPAYNPAGQLTSWTVGAVNASTPALTGTRTYDNRLRVTTETVAGHD